MAMAIAVTASTFSCPRCRDLTSSLINSVDAFETLGVGEEGIPAEFVISTIRKIISKAIAHGNESESNSEKTNRQPQTPKDDTASGHTSVNSALALNTIGDFYMADNLDSDNAGHEQDNIFDNQFQSDENLISPVLKKTRKRKRQGRTNWYKKKISKQIQIQVDSNVKSHPRKSGRRLKMIAPANLSLPPEEGPVNDGSQKNQVKNGPRKNQVKDGSKNNSLVPSSRGKGKTVPRPIATEEDFERALEYMKRLKLETPDGQFYFLYECTECSQRFPDHNYNVRRHVIVRHFNKKAWYPSMSKKTTQPALGEVINAGRQIKVRLYNNEQNPKEKSGKKPRRNRNWQDKTGSSRMIISVVEKTKISPVGVENAKASWKRSENSRNGSDSTAVTAVSTFSSSRLPSSSATNKIPPNLTVRNPCANFDLKKAMNARVCIEWFPKLGTVGATFSGQRQGQDQKQIQNSKIVESTNEDADIDPDLQKVTIMEADSNTNEKLQENLHRIDRFRVSLGLDEPPANTQKNTESKDKDTGNTSEIPPEVVNELIKMDVESITKLQSFVMSL